MQRSVSEILEEYGYYEDVIIFKDPDYDTAFIGVTSDGQAVYDYDLMVDYLIKESVCENEEEASDFISFNDSFSQEGYPLILFRMD